jgi:hypothetical protein
MYIKAKDLVDGTTRYLNSNHYTSFVVEKDKVVAWTPDNLTLELQKTPELNEQLNSLLLEKTSKGFEKFE